MATLTRRELAEAIGFQRVERPTDGHIHLWKKDHTVWLGLGSPAVLNRDYTAPQLQGSVVQTGFSGAVVIQALDDNQGGDAETQRLLADCRHYRYLRGAVVSAPLKRGADAVREHVAKLRDDRNWGYVCGFRQIFPQDPTDVDDRAYRNPTFIAGCNALADSGKALDVLLRERNEGQYEDFLRFLEEIDPRITVIIDHFGKPRGVGEGKASSAWKSMIEAAARKPNVRLKASGLLGEAEKGTRIPKLFTFYDHGLEHFGPDRIFHGTDCPVAYLVGDYPKMVIAAMRWLYERNLYQNEGLVAKFFGRNVEAAYNKLPK